VVDVRHDCDISEILTKHSPSRLASLWERPNHPMPGTGSADTLSDRNVNVRGTDTRRNSICRGESSPSSGAIRVRKSR
jgi:hypothetical protein